MSQCGLQSHSLSPLESSGVSFPQVLDRESHRVHTEDMTKTQSAALETIRSAGVVYSGSGISRATVGALLSAGLVTVESEVVVYVNSRGRTRSHLNWSARIK